MEDNPNFIRRLENGTTITPEEVDNWNVRAVAGTAGVNFDVIFKSGSFSQTENNEYVILVFDMMCGMLIFLSSYAVPNKLLLIFLLSDPSCCALLLIALRTAEIGRHSMKLEHILFLPNHAVMEYYLRALCI